MWLTSIMHAGGPDTYISSFARQSPSSMALSASPNVMILLIRLFPIVLQTFRAAY